MEIVRRIILVLRFYRAVIIIACASFFIELGFSIVNISTLPVYLDQQLHAVEFLGVLLGLQNAFDTVSRPFLGALGDKIGRRWIVITGPILSAITAAITVHISLGFLFLLRIIDGFAAGALWTSVFAETGDITKPKNRNTAMSIVYVAFIAALALGPLIGGIVDNYFGYYFDKIGEASFILASLIFAIGSLVAYKVFRSGRKIEVAKLPKLTISWTDLKAATKKYYQMIILAFLIFLSVGFLAPLAKVYTLERYHLSELEFGYALAPVAVFLAILSIPLANLGDRWGVRKSIVGGLWVAAISSGFLVYSPEITHAMVSATFLGLGFITVIPSWLALITKIAPPRKRGEILGVIGFSEGFGGLVGAGLSGYLFSLTVNIPRLAINSTNLPFFIAFICLAISAFLSIFWIYRAD